MIALLYLVGYLVLGVVTAYATYVFQRWDNPTSSGWRRDDQLQIALGAGFLWPLSLVMGIFYGLWRLTIKVCRRPINFFGRIADDPQAYFKKRNMR